MLAKLKIDVGLRLSVLLFERILGLILVNFNICARDLFCFVNYYTVSLNSRSDFHNYSQIFFRPLQNEKSVQENYK